MNGMDMSESITIDTRDQDAWRSVVEAMGGQVVDLSSTTSVELDPLNISAR